MAQFLITYLGGNPPETPEQGQAHFAEYKAWLGKLGSAVVSQANPLKATVTIAPDGSVSQGSSTQMSGYTIVEAESIENAITMASACPFLNIGGSLEVSELVQMSM